MNKVTSNCIPAGIFKAQCLHLMNEVNKTKRPITITKHGVAVAQLIPIDTTPRSIFGALRNSVTITKDIIAPIDDPWNADE
ncbi:MAG: hypothetical protein A3F18_03105 [Legionellales bacterium RIFCSPHIGHO2_12_FULL_37_14]|nr:MAG: hypothetical protein A3F18_03105 [Legionellales bacterium RIFCSPHIGHO2_12_FULL_37_14]